MNVLLEHTAVVIPLTAPTLRVDMNVSVQRV